MKKIINLVLIVLLFADFSFAGVLDEDRKAKREKDEKECLDFKYRR